jgi:hypothetical protein
VDETLVELTDAELGQIYGGYDEPIEECPVES